MGYDVHLHVCFACNRNEPVAALAQKHLANLGLDADRDARWFLEDLSKRTGENPGRKGGLSLWGIIGNYANVGGDDGFVQTLIPFWDELLRSEMHVGPLDFEHILVFEEQEQSEQAVAYEIYLDREGDNWPNRGPLLIKVHECPFTWMQL